MEIIAERVTFLSSKRIEDDSVQAEIRQIYKELIENIKTTITTHLVTNDNTETDVEGAGDFIPQVDNNTVNKNGASSKPKILDVPKAQKKLVKSVQQ